VIRGGFDKIRFAPSIHLSLNDTVAIVILLQFWIPTVLKRRGTLILNYCSVFVISKSSHLWAPNRFKQDNFLHEEFAIDVSFSSCSMLILTCIFYTQILRIIDRRIGFFLCYFATKYPLFCQLLLIQNFDKSGASR
jgi:hypothetical protein